MWLNGKSSFLEAYRDSFRSIEGAFQYDAALLFLAYNQLINSQGICGDTLEIGVRHGLSAIAVAALRGTGRRFFAIDLFDGPPARDISAGGFGDEAAFKRNLKAFYEETDFLTVIKSDSANLDAGDLESQFSFCHIDGGHSAEETLHDLQLCSQVLLPGGLLALDDYFNPSFPGVCEGAVRFMLAHPESLMPVAIGFNKVLFQKPQASFSLNAMFSRTFSQIPKANATLWGRPVNLFWSSFLYFFDLAHSTPGHLVSNSTHDLRAEFRPQSSFLTAAPQQTILLPVKVLNKSTITFQSGAGSFGLSYHLLSSEGMMLQNDNPRMFFTEPLAPGEEALVELPLLTPEERGDYMIEIDIVWEGVAWFRDKGNPTSIVDLTVS